MALLRAGLLDGRSIAVVPDGEPALVEALSALGAAVTSEPGSGQSLLYDARRRFGAGGSDRLREAIDRGWETIHNFAAQALTSPGSGKIVLIGPGSGSGPFADAACAGLENLARTLSVEWARYGITTAMLAPGRSTSDRGLAEVVAFLLSEAGDYFSGCRLDLGS
jgi:hypothetical protein